MKKIVFLVSLLMSLGSAAWAGQGWEEDNACTAKFEGCEQSCREDVVCQLRCWEEKDGCSLRATGKNLKPTAVGVRPYSVQLTVRFF